VIWFKHMTDMVDDPKVRRLIRKHGALGYAVYNLALERIGKRLSSDSALPDLEETAEDIADLLNADTVKIEDAMRTAIQIGLFESDELTGRLVCTKMYKFLEKSQTRSKEIREMIEKYRVSQTVSDNPRPSETNLIEVEESRVDKNRIDREVDPTLKTYRDELSALLPSSAWRDLQEQTAALHRLTKMTKETQPTTPLETPEEFARMAVATYARMKQTGRGDYWKRAAFDPKGLELRFTDVVTEMAGEYDRLRREEEDLERVRRGGFLS